MRKEEDGHAGERGINRHRPILITDTAIKEGGGEISYDMQYLIFGEKSFEISNEQFSILSALSLHRLAIQPRSRKEFNVHYSFFHS